MKRIARLAFPLAVGFLLPWVFNVAVALFWMTPGLASAVRWSKENGLPVQLTVADAEAPTTTRGEEAPDRHHALLAGQVG
jgi:hypothetical protein